MYAPQRSSKPFYTGCSIMYAGLFSGNLYFLILKLAMLIRVNTFYLYLILRFETTNFSFLFNESWAAKTFINDLLFLYPSALTIYLMQTIVRLYIKNVLYPFKSNKAEKQDLILEIIDANCLWCRRLNGKDDKDKFIYKKNTSNILSHEPACFRRYITIAYLFIMKLQHM